MTQTRKQHIAAAQEALEHAELALKRPNTSLDARLDVAGKWAVVASAHAAVADLLPTEAVVAVHVEGKPWALQAQEIADAVRVLATGRPRRRERVDPWN